MTSDNSANVPSARGERLRTWLGPLFAVLVFGAAIWLLYDELRAHSWRQIVAAVQAVPPQRIILAIALTMLNYLVLAGYDQDEWVTLQKYQEEPWVELVTLWRAFNLHLAHVMTAIPLSVRGRAHRRHNLHEINWRPVPADRPATLDDLMEDYVAHLKHHLRQILGSTWDVSPGAASRSQRVGA